MKITLPVISFVISSLVSASAANYYVATTGSDANPGSASQPWRTIQKAANTVVGGDVVRVQPGTYNERVAEGTSGNAANYITYLSESPTNAIVRGFNITGSYIRIIGFQITHVADVAYEAVRVDRGNHVEVLDNYIHNVSTSGAGSGVTYGGAPYLVVRGNVISYTGSPGDNNGLGAKSIGNIFGSGGSAPVLIEYNSISHTTDYLTPQGGLHIYRNNVLGPTTTNDFGGGRHVDGYQPNEGTTNCFMEANWHVDNPISDSHLYLDEIAPNHHIALIKNVSIRSGDRLCVQWRVSTNHLAAHNTFGQIGFGPRGGPGNGGAFYVWDNSINNVSRNNIFTNCTSGSSIYATANGGTITTDHDLSWPLGNAALQADPKFVNYAGYDFTLRSNSPAVSAAGALTTVTSSSGTGTSFSVSEPYWFCDGFNGLAEGHKIYVGNNNNLTVTAVDYPTRTVTVSSSITWANGDKVGYAFLGTGPDIGAYEYGARSLTSATISTNGNNYTVTPTGDARFVAFYRDGIPYAKVNTSPYTTAISSGIVTAKVYALHPQAFPVVIATPSSAPAPAPPTNLRIVPN